MTAFSSLVAEMKFFESAMLTLRSSFPFPYIIFGKFFYYIRVHRNKLSFIFLFLPLTIHYVLINLL